MLKRAPAPDGRRSSVNPCSKPEAAALYQTDTPSPNGSVVLLAPKTNPPGDNACPVVLPTDSGVRAKPPEPAFGARNQTRPRWPHNRVIPLGDVTGWDASALSMTTCRP